MFNIIKIIKSIDINLSNYKLEYNYVSLDDIIDMILNHDMYLEKNKLNIIDIKDLNDKQKIILTMFIYNYIHTNPPISKYNRYIDLLPNRMKLLNYPIIFRVFYVTCNVLNQSKIKFKHNNILQVGVLPTVLEAYIRIKRDTSINNFDFVQTSTTKFDTNYYNFDIYEYNIQKFFELFPYINRIKDIHNFYSTNLKILINHPKLKLKYDFIIFDTYKKLYNFIDEDIPENINLRYLMSITHTKFILKQIIFSLLKLNEHGDLMLLFHGSSHIVYQQLLTILSGMFEEIVLINSDMDFSWRYFVICKNYTSNKHIIHQFQQFKDVYDDKILINIFPNTNILDINIELDLRVKFKNIEYRIRALNEYFINDLFIKKLHKNIYYNQLKKTYLWLKHLFDINNINNYIISELFVYKTYLFNKLIKIRKNIYLLNKVNKISFLDMSIDKKMFDEIIYVSKYFKLYDLICYTEYDEFDYHNIYKQLLRMSEIKRIIYQKDNTINIEYIDLIQVIKYLDHILLFSQQLNKSDNISIISSGSKISELKELFIKFNIFNIIYIDWECYNNQNLFNKLPDIYIIEFKLTSMSSLLISIFYILSSLYNNTIIYYPVIFNFKYYFISFHINNNDDKIIKHLYKFFNINKHKFNNDYGIISISEDYIVNIIHIFNKLFMIELLNIIRCKYAYYYPEYIDFHYMLSKQNNILTKYIKKII